MPARKSTTQHVRYRTPVAGRLIGIDPERSLIAEKMRIIECCRPKRPELPHSSPASHGASSRLTTLYYIF
jgi:hypothetical protein